MLDPGFPDNLPPIPAKRYFSIGEVSALCFVRPHVIRYWEQEFEQLRPLKRRGNRRYYQSEDVFLVRRISSLIHGKGFTVSGARQQLAGEETCTDLTRSRQLVRQLRLELEEILGVLRR